VRDDEVYEPARKISVLMTSPPPSNKKLPKEDTKQILMGMARVMQYIIGDATLPGGQGPRIIAHICNNRGGYGKGFALAVANRWPKAERRYREWYDTQEGFSLGSVQVVDLGQDMYVANMIAQQGYRTAYNPHPLRLDALALCLARLSDAAIQLKASVHMPRIGTGLSGGSWHDIEPIIIHTLGTLEVFVYDLKVDFI